MALYSERFATRISRNRNRRLRLAAVLAGRPLSAFLDDTLDAVLPTEDELAERMREMAATEEAAS